MIEAGAPQTPFLSFGERVRIEAFFLDPPTASFGQIYQRIVER